MFTTKVMLAVILMIVSAQCIEVGTNLPISGECDIMLNVSLNNLVGELRKFGTWLQNNYLLSQAINNTYNALAYVSSELSAYNNVILGSNNIVNGSNNLIVGSYDNITGSNNFVFTSNYSGSVDGDLIIDSWKVQLDKRNMVMLFPYMVVSVLTVNESTLYGGYVRNFQPPTKNVLCLVNDIVATVNSVVGTGAASTGSVSLLPSILTPLLNLIPTQTQTTASNLRTNSISTPTSTSTTTSPTNQPLVNLSLPLLNKSWLSF